MSNDRGPMTATEALARHEEHWRPIIKLLLNGHLAAIYDTGKLAQVFETWNGKSKREPSEQDKALHRAIRVREGWG